VLIDIHAHPAMNAFLWGRDLRKHYWSGPMHTFNPLASLSDFKMLEKGGVDVLWSSLHIPERQYFDCLAIRLLAKLFAGGRRLLSDSPWDNVLAQMAAMERQVARAERFELARSNAELDAALAAGKIAIVHTVEGGDVLSAGLADADLDGRRARVDELADRGVASITLAHLFPNDLAGHAEGIPERQRKFPLCPLDTKVDLSVGLKTAGRAVVEQMVERRIVPDVSHCTRAARQQIYDLVANRVPIVATHVGVRPLNDVEYNLDEGDVKAIAASRGVVGVIFMPYWLDAANPDNGLAAIWKTMDTVRRWTGSWEHVALGTDFDGFTDPADDCKNSSELPKVRTLLESNGVAPADVEAVLGGNARRVLRDAWR
jgi:microsomal dipeptidase-like Zn-dependent dipeptidase